LKDFQVDRTRFDSRVCIGNDFDTQLIIAMQRWRSGLWKAMKRGLSEMVSLLLESTKFKLWESGGYERFAIIDKSERKGCYCLPGMRWLVLSQIRRYSAKIRGLCLVAVKRKGLARGEGGWCVL
jgi:hypothetical protein